MDFRKGLDIGGRRLYGANLTCSLSVESTVSAVQRPFPLFEEIQIEMGADVSRRLLVRSVFPQRRWRDGCARRSPRTFFGRRAFAPVPRDGHEPGVEVRSPNSTAARNCRHVVRRLGASGARLALVNIIVATSRLARSVPLTVDWHLLLLGDAACFSGSNDPSADAPRGS